MYCGKCGAEISEDSNVCSQCGSPVDQHNTESNINQNTFDTSNEQNTSNTQYGESSQHTAQTPPTQTPKRKSKLVAGLLNILLPFGIGRLYLGYTGIGVAQLLLAFCCAGSIWSFIDGILILTGSPAVDASGNPLLD